MSYREHLRLADIHIKLANICKELAVITAIPDPHLAMECDSEYCDNLAQARKHLKAAIKIRKGE